MKFIRVNVQQATGIHDAANFYNIKKGKEIIIFLLSSQSLKILSFLFGKIADYDISQSIAANEHII